MTYTFTAGPASDPFKVTTPYTGAAVDLTATDLGLSEAEMKGALCMLFGPARMPESMLDVALDAADGTGRRTTLRAIRAALARWTRIDREARRLAVRPPRIGYPD